MSSCHDFMMSWCHHVIMSSCNHLCHPVSFQVSNFWQLLTTFANSWELLSTFEYSWLLLAIFGNFEQLFGHVWQQLTTFAYFCQHSATSNVVQFLAIFVNFCRCHLETFVNFWLLVAMIGYFLYLLATFSNVWQYLAKFDSICQFWHFCHNWQLMAAFGNFCHLVVLSFSCLVI